MTTSMFEDWLQGSPFHLFHRAMQRANAAVQIELGSADLTPRQCAVLLTLAANNGLSQASVGERIGTDRSTMAAIIERMVEKGLVKRHRTLRDRRTNIVELTAEGRRAITFIEPVMERAGARLLGVLPSQDQERFLQELRLIVENRCD